jgi:hypothetical protein
MQDQSKELQQIRDSRKQGYATLCTIICDHCKVYAFSIIEKLTALGYEKDIESIHLPDCLEDHRIMKQPQQLTECSKFILLTILEPRLTLYSSLE